METNGTNLTWLLALAWPFGWMVLWIVVWQLRVRARERASVRRHQERMLAMEKGIPLPELPPESEGTSTADVVARLRLNPRWPLGLAAICGMTGLGVTLGMWLSGVEEYRNHASMGLIGVFLGAGLWLHYLLTRR